MVGGDGQAEVSKKRHAGTKIGTEVGWQLHHVGKQADTGTEVSSEVAWQLQVGVASHAPMCGHPLLYQL